MSKDILSGYGPGSNQPQRAGASSGGVLSPKDVMNYSPPVGPKGINAPQSPGLHGTNKGDSQNMGNGGPDGGHSSAGCVNHGCGGSQGRY